MPAVIKNRFIKNILLPALTTAIAVLLFVIVYQYLPNANWPYSIDKLLVLAFILVALFLLVRLFWPVLIISMVCIAAWFGNSWYNSNYTMDSFYKDGQYVFNDLRGVQQNKNFVYTGYGSLYNDKAILAAIDYRNPIVRDFAVNACNTYFEKEQQQARTDETRLLIQAFAVFKKVNNKWNYVSDPAGEEYFAKASESTSLLAGDCDDYSILMAGAIKAIGGKVRLLCVKGHIYPEMYIGTAKDLNAVAALIQKKLFVFESNGKKLNYHTDDKGNIWLNLDYTTLYPGGGFMDNTVREFIYP